MIDFQAARTAMVDGQIRPSDVTQYPILEAMLSVPREVFVPASQRPVAYVGEDLDIGEARSALAPRTLAKMLESLSIIPTDLVLDVGCGLGYSAAVIARMAEAVVAIEQEPLASEAATLLPEHGVYNVVTEAAVLSEGAPKHGPYDAIVIEGAVEIIPDSILEQLKLGGRICAIFVSGREGHAKLGRKTAAGINWDTVFDARAPLLTGFEAPREFRL